MHVAEEKEGDEEGAEEGEGEELAGVPDHEAWYCDEVAPAEIAEVEEEEVKGVEEEGVGAGIY